MDGKCIKNTEVCDRDSKGCHCVQCSDEEVNFCENIWQCAEGTSDKSGICALIAIAEAMFVHVVEYVE